MITKKETAVTGDKSEGDGFIGLIVFVIIPNVGMILEAATKGEYYGVAILGKTLIEKLLCKNIANIYYYICSDKSETILYRLCQVNVGTLPFFMKS